MSTFRSKFYPLICNIFPLESKKNLDDRLFGKIKEDLVQYPSTCHSLQDDALYQEQLLSFEAEGIEVGVNGTINL
ncbi:hypothetical protein [Niallia sp. Krafla_26]|uniref:hypothetical protein n=1 Tax=Niallia sp. Krafla_26 TaxID=3064703 RepID=UPI003D174A33